MRRLLTGLAALVPAVVLTAAQPDAKEKDKAVLRAGANLPGPFHPYNLTGKFEGRFHCPISEQDLDPTVLILTREIEPTAALEQLVVDSTVAALKNRETRLTCVVVFLPKLDEPRADARGKDKEVEKGLELDPAIERQNTIEDNRLESAEKLKLWIANVKKKVDEKVPPVAKAEGDMQKIREKEPLVVCVCDPNDLPRYKLNETDKTVVVLYSKLEVQSAVIVETLKDEDVKVIMKDVADRLGAVRK